MSFIAARSMGQLPISIATAIAIESFLGIKTDDRTPAHPKNVDELWVNLYTVFRNFTGSMEGQTYLDCDEGELYHALMEEISQITMAARSYSRSIAVRVYVCDHEGIENRYPYGRIRTPSTDRQIIYTKAATKMINQLSNELKDSSFVSFLRFRQEITGNYAKNVLMLTHQIIDLLAYPRFRDLKLLESHTGSVKARTRWHTKLTSSKNNPHLPFSPLVLQVFGDSEHFRPFSSTYTGAVSELSIRRRWSAVTTREKMQYDITNYMHDKLAASIKEELLAMV